MERVALISGCSSGIGRATAHALRDEEWSVMATAREPATLGALQDRGCRTARLDVTAADEVEAVVDETLDRWGRIDCLVNNAGYSQLGPVEDISNDRLRRQFAVNVHGAHRLTRAVLPAMRDRADGTIINVSSVTGRLALPGAGAYAASKFALEALSASLRAEVSPFGIDVVVVGPGSVQTNFHERASDELAGLERTAAYDPLYRIIEDWEAADGFGPTALEAEEVAAVIVNAASATRPEARYPAGPIGRYAPWVTLIPARVRDRVYRAVLWATSLRADR